MKPVKTNIAFDTKSNSTKLFADLCAEENISFGKGVMELILSSQVKNRKPDLNSVKKLPLNPSYKKTSKATSVQLVITDKEMLKSYISLKNQCKKELTTIPKKVLELINDYLASQKSDNESYTISLPITLTRSKLSNKQTNQTYVLDDKGNKFKTIEDLHQAKVKEMVSSLSIVSDIDRLSFELCGIYTKDDILYVTPHGIFTSTDQPKKVGVDISSDYLEKNVTSSLWSKWYSVNGKQKGYRKLLDKYLLQDFIVNPDKYQPIPDISYLLVTPNGVFKTLSDAASKDDTHHTRKKLQSAIESENYPRYFRVGYKDVDFESYKKQIMK